MLASLCSALLWISLAYAISSGASFLCSCQTPQAAAGSLPNDRIHPRHRLWLGILMLQPVSACNAEAPNRPVSATSGISGTQDFFSSRQLANVRFAELSFFGLWTGVLDPALWRLRVRKRWLGRPSRCNHAADRPEQQHQWIRAL